MTQGYITQALAKVEQRYLALVSAQAHPASLHSPRDCWLAMKTACPNPDNVLMVQAAHDAITAINTATLSTDTQAGWWADMIGYQDVLASRLRADAKQGVAHE